MKTQVRGACVILILGVVATVACPVAQSVTAPLAAQSIHRALDAQGTASYNLLWNTTAHASDCFCLRAYRFSGRVSIRIRPQLYVGISAGSLEYAIAVTADGKVDPNIYSAVATSVVLSSYVQVYPGVTHRVFVRSGIGYAANRTYYPDLADTVEFDNYLTRAKSGHASITAGVGADLPVRGHFAMTLAADYTLLLGATTGREPTSSISIGLGLTLR
jgi:hypothetical protein